MLLHLCKAPIQAMAPEKEDSGQAGAQPAQPAQSAQTEDLVRGSSFCWSNGRLSVSPGKGVAEGYFRIIMTYLFWG